MLHDLDGPADIRFAQSNAHGRCDRQEPGIELAVACIAFGRELHKIRAPVLRIVDEFDERLGRMIKDIGGDAATFFQLMEETKKTCADKKT